MSIARIKKNDTVIVTHGNDAGRTGTVKSVNPKKGTAIVTVTCFGGAAATCVVTVK